MMIMESPNKLLDASGQVVKYANVPPNLDPTFFFGFPRGGNVTTGDIDRHPYRHHPWVHACAWNIVRNISRLPIMLWDTKKKCQIEDKWGIIKRFHKPNPYMTYTTFIQQVLLNLILPARKVFDAGGQCFIVPKVASDKNKGHMSMLKGDTPDVLLVYNDDHIRPKKTDADNGMQSLVGWEFYVSGKENMTELYHPDEIIRVYFANPYDTLAGLSMYEPARLAILSDIKSDIYNTRIFDNNAVPAGILSSKQTLKQDQRREIFQAWMEEYGGSGNSGKTAVLGNDMTYQPIAQSAKDMEWQAAKQDSFDKIIASFGLNKIALGKYEQINYATIIEGRKILWEDGYLPVGELLLESINSHWIQNIQENLELRFDTSGIDALKIKKKVNVEMAGLMIQSGIPAVEAYKLCDVPLPEDMATKYPWLAEQPKGNEPAIPEVPTEEPAAPKEEKTSSSQKMKIITNNMQVADLYLLRVFIPGENALHKSMTKFFIRQRNKMQDKVDDWLDFTGKSNEQYQVSKHGGISAEGFELNPYEENAILAEVLKPHVASQARRVSTTLHDMYASIEWDVTDSTLEVLMRKRLREVKEINRTTNKVALEKIKDALQKGQEEHVTIGELSKRVKEAIGEGMEIRKNQARTIARTEMGIVTGESQQMAFKENDVEWIKWTTANDEHVRDSHKEQGQDGNNVTRFGTPFSITRLQYPGDADGDAGEIINCRCVAVPVANKEGDFYE